MFQADIQRGFLIRPILWREPTCQHHHGKSSLWGRDASSGFPDQTACGSDTPVTTWTLLCAQSTQLHQLWDQEQRRAHSEELYFGRRGNNMTLMLFCALKSLLGTSYNITRNILFLPQNYRYYTESNCIVMDFFCVGVPGPEYCKRIYKGVYHCSPVC